MHCPAQDHQHHTPMHMVEPSVPCLDSNTSCLVCIKMQRQRSTNKWPKPSPHILPPVCCIIWLKRVQQNCSRGAEAAGRVISSPCKGPRRQQPELPGKQTSHGRLMPFFKGVQDLDDQAHTWTHSHATVSMAGHSSCNIRMMPQSPHALTQAAADNCEVCPLCSH
jgi:hypothetical protein